MATIEPNKNNTIVYCIPHCPLTVDGSVIKNSIVTILANLMCKTYPEARVLNGERVTILLLSTYTRKGDFRRFEDEVVRYVDIYGATNRAECMDRVEKLHKKIEEISEPMDETIMGLDIIDRYIDRLGMTRFGAERFETRIDDDPEFTIW